MRPLKLCFVGWGDHVHLERWAGYFARTGDEVSVLSMGGEGDYPAGVRQYVLRNSKRRPVLADAEMRVLLWRLRPQIVHVHWAHFAVPVVRVWNGPLVITAWGSDIYRQDEFTPSRWTSMRNALSRANLVTCDSEDLGRALHTRCGVDEASVKIVQWGIDTNAFAPGPSKFAEELGIAGRPVVFSARNFAPVYNLETVVDAFALARRSVPSAFLLMKSYAPEPDYAKAIRNRIAALGLERDTHIVEAIDYARMPDLYRAAKVTVSVPHSDATPMSMLEAMACGSLPLFSDLPSLREWIVDGDNGCLAAATDTEGVAQRMVRALTDDAFCARAAAINRELVVERASQSVHMQHCRELYLDAIARAGSVKPAMSAK
jgi:glycosyltransferase involved in cell wall biosynthesis